MTVLLEKYPAVLRQSVYVTPRIVLENRIYGADRSSRISLIEPQGKLEIPQGKFKTWQLN